MNDVTTYCFRVEIEEAGCVACGALPTYHIVGRDGADTGRTYNEEADADEDCASLNYAYVRGKEDERVRLAQLAEEHAAGGAGSIGHGG